MVPTESGMEDWLEQSKKLGQRIKSMRSATENQTQLPLNKVLSLKKTRSKKGAITEEPKKVFNHAVILQ